MTFRDYRGYFIVASAFLNQVTRDYAPVAAVSWRLQDGTRGIHLINHAPEHFCNKDKATQFALDQARSWVDERTTTSGLVTSP
jgi:hypothetical protein